jgi:2-polyprenyl-3-methyl-5-hydroxy-6-metoxy-1,4-benzoquinol methylase
MTDITDKYQTIDGRPLGTPHVNTMEQDFSRIRYTFICKDLPYFYQDSVVLDCGGGYGTGADELLKRGATQVDCVDLNPDAIEIGKEMFPDPKINYICSSWNDLKGPYDIVVAVELVEHLTDVELDASLKQWHDILLDNGCLYITTPRLRGQKSDFPRGSHFTEFEFEELVNLVSKYGFELLWSEVPEKTDSVSMALVFKKVRQ